MKKKVGVLGGGQLGKMFQEENPDLEIYFLDKKDSPVSRIIPSDRFFEGDLTNYDDVMSFGKDKESITIEIEKVNVDALDELEKQGKQIFPNPRVIRMIQDKGNQKLHYKNNDIATAPFTLYHDIHNLKADMLHKDFQFPVMQKLCFGQYDGRGVQKISSMGEIDLLLDGPCIIEQFIDIKWELSVIIAKSDDDYVVMEPVEMVFDYDKNILDYQICPARIPQKIKDEAILLARQTVDSFDSNGLFAVELIVTSNNEVIVNEVAPRPHNSGHHTIEAASESQYRLLRKVIFNQIFFNQVVTSESVMVNLLGEKGFSGPAFFKGKESMQQSEGYYLHEYGKLLTRPKRKMGHVTILGDSREECLKRLSFVKQNVSVESL